MTQAEQRAAVVDVARSWLRTPFLNRARIKGAGIDCGTLLCACFEETGLVPPIVLPEYSVQWHLNQDDEKYLRIIDQHFARIAGPPQPGDIALWKIGRTFSHAAIVAEWPVIIHALWGVGVTLDDAEKCPQLVAVGAGEVDAGKPRIRRFYSFWAKPA